MVIRWKAWLIEICFKKSIKSWICDPGCGWAWQYTIISLIHFDLIMKPITNVPMFQISAFIIVPEKNLWKTVGTSDVSISKGSWNGYSWRCEESKVKSQYDKSEKNADFHIHAQVMWEKWSLSTVFEGVNDQRWNFRDESGKWTFSLVISECRVVQKIQALQQLHWENHMQNDFLHTRFFMCWAASKQSR